MSEPTSHQEKTKGTFIQEAPTFLSLVERLYVPSYLRPRGDSYEDLLESDYYRILQRLSQRIEGFGL